MQQNEFPSQREERVEGEATPLQSFFPHKRPERLRTLVDFLAQAARLVLEACSDIEETFGHSVGINKLVGFLMGQDSAFMRQNGLAELALYGAFHYCRKGWVEHLILRLKETGYIKVAGSFRPVLCLSEEGAELLDSPHELPILPREVLADPYLGPACAATPLEMKLREIRAKLGRKLHRTPRQLVSDMVLRVLARSAPRAKEEVEQMLPKAAKPHSAIFWEVLKREKERIQQA